MFAEVLHKASVCADLSETQKQLVEINQRYDHIGERLTDRQNELQSTLESVRSYLEDVREMLQWLESKEPEAPTIDTNLPIQEDEAARLLKEHKVRHEINFERSTSDTYSLYHRFDWRDEPVLKTTCTSID